MDLELIKARLLFKIGVELVKPWYYLLPTVEVSQDINMADINPNEGVIIKHFMQPDGSRLKLFRGRRLYMISNDTQDELISIMKEYSPSIGTIWKQTYLNIEELPGIIHKCRENPSRYIYIAYRTHNFLNGVRYIPIILDTTLQTFVDISTHFIHNLPDDDIGVIIPYENCWDTISEGLDIEVPGGVLVPRIINYLGNLRLCSCCGIVSNTARPRKVPWVNVYSIDQLLQRKEETLMRYKHHIAQEHHLYDSHHRDLAYRTLSHTAKSSDASTLKPRSKHLAKIRRVRPR